MSARRQLAALVLVALAFGIVEGAVVVYLRELYYPAGFVFPLVAIPGRILATEVAREVATLLLLLGLAGMVPGGGQRRFAAFAFAFGVWDLIYYATLRVAIGWPAGWLDWDVLFLIPVPWLAPWPAPALVSVALIGAAVPLLLQASPPALRARDWLVLATGGTAILATFFWNGGALARGEAPGAYPWWLFAAGWLLGVLWLARAWRRPR